MENALEWIITALGHYHRLEKTQENESALQCLRNAIELLQKEENSPKGIVLNHEEFVTLLGAINCMHSDIQKNLADLKKYGSDDKFPELSSKWERDLALLEGIRRKTIKSY